MNKFPFDPYDFFGYLASGLLVLIGAQYIVGFPKVIGTDMKLIDVEGGIVLLMAYVAGQIIAGPSRFILESIVVDKVLKRPSVNLFRTKAPRVYRVLFPGYYERLPTKIGNKVLEKARKAGIADTGEALFLHVRFLDSVRKDEALMKRLDPFLNKYGFARNLSFTCFLLAAAFALKSYIGPSPELFKYAYAALAGGVFLFYRYLKFFRQYSYELFNTYAGSA